MTPTPARPRSHAPRVSRMCRRRVHDRLLSCRACSAAEYLAPRRPATRLVPVTPSAAAVEGQDRQGNPRGKARQGAEGLPRQTQQAKTQACEKQARRAYGATARKAAHVNRRSR